MCHIHVLRGKELQKEKKARTQKREKKRKGQNSLRLAFKTTNTSKKKGKKRGSQANTLRALLCVMVTYIACSMYACNGSRWAGLIALHCLFHVPESDSATAAGSLSPSSSLQRPRLGVHTPKDILAHGNTVNSNNSYRGDSPVTVTGERPAVTQPMRDQSTHTFSLEALIAAVRNTPYPGPPGTRGRLD